MSLTKYYEHFVFLYAAKSDNKCTNYRKEQWHLVAANGENHIISEQCGDRTDNTLLQTTVVLWDFKFPHQGVWR